MKRKNSMKKKGKMKPGTKQPMMKRRRKLSQQA